MTINFDFLIPEKFSKETVPEVATDITSGRNHIRESGFVVIKNCFQPRQTKKLLSLFEESLLHSESSLPRITGYRKLEKNVFSAKGHMSNALMNMQLEDPSHYQEEEKLFTKLALELITTGNHIEFIKKSTNKEALQLMTWNVFHSVSPGTLPHQDCIFFNPNISPLKILGIRIALEDIDPDSSPLYVQRYSHVKSKEQTRQFRSITPEYRNYLKAQLLEKSSDIVAPILRAGDCIIWDSRTVHGSLKKINPEASRLSITAHFTGWEPSIARRLLKVRSRSQLASIKEEIVNFQEIKSYKTTNNVRVRINKEMRKLLDS